MLGLWCNMTYYLAICKKTLGWAKSSTRDMAILMATDYRPYAGKNELVHVWECDKDAYVGASGEHVGFLGDPAVYLRENDTGWWMK